MPLHQKFMKVDLFDAMTWKVEFLCLSIKKVRHTLKHVSGPKRSDFAHEHVLKHVMHSKKCDFAWRHFKMCKWPQKIRFWRKTYFKMYWVHWKVWFERKYALSHQEFDFGYNSRFSSWICKKIFCIQEILSWWWFCLHQRWI